MDLRFHWSLSQVGDKFRRTKATTNMTGLLSLGAQIEFCRRAEQCGIESVLMAFGFTRPDPSVLSVALGKYTEKIKFMIACRSGIFSPAFFVQQINTVSALTGGRVCVNIVTGHTPHELRYYGDFLNHDERYERTGEFLSVCRAFWEQDNEVEFDGKHYRVQGGKLNTPFVSSGRRGPEIFLGGNSELADQLAIEHAHCLWRFPDGPERLAPRIAPLLERGVEAGLLVSLICRPTREQAVECAHAMLEQVGEQPRRFHKEFAEKSDSVGFKRNFELAEDSASEWLTPVLWTGAVPYLGAPAIALVGSWAEIASAIIEYKQIGISQFLFMGWPDLEEMIGFSDNVLPLIRQMEAALGGGSAPASSRRVPA
jgi:alkanesulfonate monooxygenase